MSLLKTIPLIALLLCSCNTLSNKSIKKNKINPSPVGPPKRISYPEFLRQMSPEFFEHYMEKLERQYDWFEIYPKKFHEQDNYS